MLSLAVRGGSRRAGRANFFSYPPPETRVSGPNASSVAMLTLEEDERVRGDRHLAWLCIDSFTSGCYRTL